ncbi:TonB-dependent receptor plug domain-containing protein [Novosphingobium umbonatum]|nr:TonB-dependent receptor [Novosphingobium umbonatum]
MAKAAWGMTICALAGGVPVAQAQESELTVIGQPLPPSAAQGAYSSQTLGRDALMAAPSGRIEDVLGNVAGFQQFRRSDSRSANPSAQGANLRALGGNAASRTLVLLDGVPMADPMFGAVPWSAMAPERLGAIRVTRGGGSGAFGAGAVAGTIEMESAPRGSLMQGEAAVNDRGESSLTGMLSPRLGAGFAQVSGRWDRGAGFWTTPVDQRVPASAKARFDSWSASARAVAPIGTDMELQGRVTAYDDHRTLRFAGANSHASGEDASLRLIGRGRWKFDLLGYLQDRGFSNITISATTFRTSLDQRQTPATGLGGKLEIRPPVGGGHVLRLGADWRRAQGDLSEVAYNAATGAVTAYRNAGGRNEDKGLFVEDDWQQGPLTLTLGLRADRWSVDGGYNTARSAAGVVTQDLRHASRADWAVTGRGGALLKLADGASLRASAYTGLRQPTINELYRSFSLVASGVTTVTNANPLLANEKLEGYEAGLDLAPAPWLKLSATAFINRLGNAIANVTIAQTATTITRQRQNVDAIRAKGVELAASVHAGAWSMEGSMALTDSVVRTSGAMNGMRPSQTPRVSANVQARWQPAKGWQAVLGLRHVGPQYEDDLQVFRMAPATTLNAFVQAPLGHGASLILRGENLGDAAVQTRYQGANSIDLAAPRTVWAGIRFGG